MIKNLIFIFVLAMLIAINSYAETFKISGKVINEENKPLINAKIKVLGTTKSLKIKDSLGKFELIITGKKAFIQISYIGYENQNFNVNKDSVNMLIVMRPIDLKADITDLKVESSIKSESASPLMLKKISGESGEGVDLGGFASIIEFDERNVNKVGSGLLTAGEVNDFTKWNLWTDISNNVLAEYQKNWGFAPQERYSVLFQTKSQFPIFGAKVILKNNDGIIWESITDNTGKAELWNNPFYMENHQNRYDLTIELQYDNKLYEIRNPKIFQEGINFIYAEMNCKAPLEADIAFVVDATGSMQDEINYLKEDLNNIISSIKDSLPSIDINLGSVFYRDKGDEYITKQTEMSNDINKTIDFIKANNAKGGGDPPEAVHTGLNAAINQLKWRENAVARIIFLILDAPPHKDKYVIDSLKMLIQSASKKGIRIIPVTCSGIDKSTEYLMRTIALFTNGTYTFLTDDSGIGGSHIKPTTDKYDVETFNALLKRLIHQYLMVPNCDLVNTNLKSDTSKVEVVTGLNKETSIVDSSQTESSNPNSEKLTITCYPNPTSGILNIETFGKIDELFISDFSGKIMMRTEVKNQNNLTLNLSNFPNGTYYVLCIYNIDKILKGKFIIIH